MRETMVKKESIILKESRGLILLSVNMTTFSMIICGLQYTFSLRLLTC